MSSSKSHQAATPDCCGRAMLFDVFSYTVYANYPLHWHDYYELQYIRSGHATLIVNGVSYEMKPGSMALLSPVEFHCFENVDADDPLKVISIKFSDHLLPENIRSDIYNPVRTMVGQSQEAEALFRKMQEEFHCDHYARDTFITAGIVQLCILLLRDLVDREDEDDVVRHTPIQQAVIYIRSHFRGSLAVEEVASIVNLTPNYFSEYFKKQTGVKFSAYVQKLRLEFAVGLLRMSDISIKQVAQQSGFNSAAYFSNAFKDAFGVSPEQFRRSSLRAVLAPKSIGDPLEHYTIQA